METTSTPQHGVRSPLVSVVSTRFKLQWPVVAPAAIRIIRYYVIFIHDHELCFEFMFCIFFIVYANVPVLQCLDVNATNTSASAVVDKCADLQLLNSGLVLQPYAGVKLMHYCS